MSFCFCNCVVSFLCTSAMTLLLGSAFTITEWFQEEYKAMVLGYKNASGLVLLLACVGENREALGWIAHTPVGQPLDREI